MVGIRADAHNFPHGRSAKRMKACLDAFEWTYKVLADRGIKTMIDLGDVFHERSHVDIHTHSEVYRIARRAKKKYGIETIWLLGNHDMYFRFERHSSSIISFDGLGPVISEPETLEIDGVPCDFYPYMEDAPGQELAKAFPRGKRSEILFFHAAIEGAILNSKTGFKRSLERSDVEDLHEDEVKECISPQFMDGWKLALGGHYHYPQVICTEPCHVEYVGSTTEHTFSEEGEKKRIILLDLETLEREDILNTFSPGFRTIDLADMDPASVDVHQKRVRVYCDDTDSKERRELRKNLIDRGAISVNILPRKTTRIDKEMHRMGIKNAASWLDDESAMIRRYAKLMAPVDLTRDHLVTIGEEVVAGASQKRITDDR